MRRVFFAVASVILIWAYCEPIYANQSELRTEFRVQNNVREVISRTFDQAGRTFDVSSVLGRSGGWPDPLDATGSLLWPTSDPTGMMNNLSVSDDGSVAAIAIDLNNQRLEVYDGVTGAISYTVPAEGGGWGSVAVSSVGDYVVYGTGNRVHLLPPDDSAPYWSADPGPNLAVVRVSMSRDGLRILAMEGATESDQDSLHIWGFTTESGIPVWTRAYHYPTKGEFYGGVYSADGSRLVITSRNWLSVLDPTNGNLIWEGPAYNTQYAAGVSGDGRVITYGSNNDGKIRVFHWDPSEPTYILLWSYTFTGGTSNWGTATAVSANGETVAGGSMQFTSAGYDGFLAVFDTYGDGTPLWAPQSMGDLVSDVNISDDGLTVAACSWGPLPQPGHDEAPIQVYDKYDSTPFFVYEVGIADTVFSENDLAMNPDGTRLLVGGKNAPNRYFGSGGHANMFSLDLEGGSVSGTVTLMATGDYSGVTVRIPDGTRHATTNVAGQYQIDHIPPGTYTIEARKPGYAIGQAPNIVVTEGGLVSNVNFVLDTAIVAPTNLSASQNHADHIQLNWNPATLAGMRERQREMRIAVGDEPFVDPRGPVALNALSEPEDEPPFLSRERELSNHLDEADSIRVWRSRIAGGPYSPIATLEGTATTFSDDLFGLIPGLSYHYVITAIFANGESEYSNEATGVLNDDYIDWSPTVPPATNPVTFDGILSANEWTDAVQLDISDVIGYDGQDPPGTAFLYMKYDDATNMLLVAAEDHANSTLDASEGIGFYVDDDDSDTWTYSQPGSEGNYWAYWFSTGPTLRFRSLSGGPWGADPYVFPNPLLGFSTNAGYLTMEVAIPMGFHNGYEIALYGPDRTPGIGAFIIERVGGNPVFHGWWPQDMPNIVSNPEFYSASTIDAQLSVPPASPTDVQLQRDGSSIEVTWSDPTIGIDGLPLFDPLEGINIYRNGELVEWVTAGTQIWTDFGVEFGGWYEYALAGFIFEDAGNFEGPQSIPVGMFAGGDPQLADLAYDDGDWDFFQIPAYPYDGNREAVRFERPPWVNRVYSASLLGNTDGIIGIGVAANENSIPGEQLVGPYWFDLPAVLEYVTFHFPGTEPPFVDQDSFWVTLDWQANDVWNPGLGADTDPPFSGGSFYFTNQSGWVEYPVGNYMIRCSVGDTPNSTDPGTPGVAHEFRLMGNYPNPFNPTTTIPFELAANGDATLKIYNLLGQEVATLISGPQVAGYHVVPWSGMSDSRESVTSGVYLARLESQGNVVTRKIVLIR